MISPIQLTPNMDTATMVSAINNVNRQIEGENRTKVIRDESGVDRVILGRWPDGKYGIKVSKEGVDVMNATPDQLVFNSSNNLFKIVETGTATVTAPGSTGSSAYTSVTHEVGKNPTVMAFVSFSPTGTAFPMPYHGMEVIGTNAGRVNNEISFEVVGGDTITFYWRRLAGGGSGTAYIRYYIVEETSAYE